MTGKLSDLPLEQQEIILEEELYTRRASRFDFEEYCTYVDPRYKVIATQKDRNVHRDIIQTLEDVAKGKLTRVRISCPPRTGKSEVGGIKFPSWVVGRDQTKQFILASYSEQLASSFCRKARQLVQSDRYKKVFPGFSLAHDKNTQTHRETPERGGMFSTGITGGATGRGGDILYIDDPIKNMQDAQSPVIQEGIIDWFDSTLSTRKQDENSAIILTMTRWNVYDLAGYLDEQERLGTGDVYYKLTIKAIDDEGYPIIWPGKRGPEYFFKEREKRSIKVRDALFQQDPRQMTGAVFKPGNERLFHESDFEKVGGLNKADFDLGCFIDPAFSTSKDSDDIVIRMVAQHRLTKCLYYLDIYAETSASSTSRNMVFNLCSKREMKGFNRPFISIEMSNRNKDQTKYKQDLVEDMETRGELYTLYEYRPAGEKMSRIRDRLEPRWTANKLFYNIDIIPETHKRIMDQYHKFPNLKHDDIIDCDTQALIQFTQLNRDLTKDKPKQTEAVRDPITNAVVPSETGFAPREYRPRERQPVYDPITGMPIR